MVQTYNHQELGPIEFTDRKERLHSAKASPHDIEILTSLKDRSLTAQIKREICDDINIAEGHLAPPEEKTKRFF